jgi:hypothetical protein
MEQMSVPGIGVVAVNDLFNKNGTNFLISRKYIEESGGTFTGEKDRVFHEYIHNYCDTELVIVAEHRLALRSAELSIVEHFHHLNQKSDIDDVYRKGMESLKVDHDTLQSRLKNFVEYVNAK